MAVTTKKTFPATTNATTTVFSPVSIQLNNQDDLDVYVTLSGGTRVLQLRQSTGSTAQSSHPQVNNTDGLYFPAVSAGTTLYNYTLSSDNNTITFNSALPQGAVVFCERRTRDADSAYTTFASGSTIRATDLNNSSTESNFTAQDARNKALDLEGSIFGGIQPSIDGVPQPFVNSSKIIDGSIARVDIANDAINGDKIADDSINSEHYVDGSIDTQHIAAGALTNILLNNSSVTSDKIVDQTIVAGDIANNTITTNQIATGTLDNRYYTETELDAGQLDNRYFTETELTGGSLDGRYFTETESDARYFRQDSSETIASGDTWSSSDAFVATTGAINARIIDLVDEVGGFTVIADELSFPNTNPQGATGQSAILSIGALTQGYTPTGTTVTIANGTVGNSTVTVTGVPSVLPQGFGILVESTSTLNTYTFHRLVPKATEVTTVASNISNIVIAGQNVSDINNFVDLYQISQNAPIQRTDGTSLQVGDLWFDNANDTLRVYDGTNWAIISPSQTVLDDISIVSGVITYQEDLGLISDAVTTGTSNGSLDIVADALEDEVTFTVTAATGKFIIDGVDKPALTLYKGWTYTFDVSDQSNGQHPLRFKDTNGAYTTNVVVTGIQGNAGAKVVIKIPETQPTNFEYYCTNHSGMGNTITVKDDPIKTVSDNISNINAVANNTTNINAVNSNSANINLAATNEANINRYADEYVIQSGTPSSPSGGDLWFNTTSNTLNFYNGTAWVGISPGISGLINDPNPQLANHLDCNDKNLTEVATISGNNLQLDFGTL